MLKVTLIPIILLLFSPTLFGQVILIDPGHGGEDCGAMAYLKKSKGKKIQVICEKDVALKIAKKIHSFLKNDFKVYLTRSIDSTLTLDKRADMADKIRADIFISIHLNASSTKRGHGFETFYLSNHNDEAVRKIEKIENKNKKGEQVIINQILADLVIERTAPRSKKLANLIHTEISKSIKTRFNLVDRGIKAALFYVLALSKRTSILLEAGFISNDNEIKKILSEDFQNRYAKSVAKGIRKYFSDKKPIPFF